MSSKLFLAAAILANVAFAIPTVAELPEIIPGPGMPSLESLNLTSRGLHEMIKRDFPLSCNTGPPGCSQANAQACINYLSSLGGQACTVDGDNTVFCTAGDAGVGGSNISGGGSVSSACADVARGGQQVIDSCSSNGGVQGANAANGNGNLVVTIESASYLG